MRKGEILNADIVRVISQMGHTDRLVIADCGLPIPPQTERIDIALRRGVPGFIVTLETVLSEFECESAIVAEEIKTANPAVHDALLKRIERELISYVPHETFKLQTGSAKAVIRTGENTPYANVILQSGVVF